jgi:hypothetical protein
MGDNKENTHPLLDGRANQVAAARVIRVIYLIYLKRNNK